MSEDGHHTNYVKIWAILVGLLVISVVGPMAEIRWLTLITAFGIACVKAYLVADKFMHINEMPKFINYIVVACLILMALFFTAVAPDVMNDKGSNWEKPLWVANEQSHWVTVGGLDDHGIMSHETETHDEGGHGHSHDGGHSHDDDDH